jgi:hypothetical protein
MVNCVVAKCIEGYMEVSQDVGWRLVRCQSGPETIFGSEKGEIMSLRKMRRLDDGNSANHTSPVKWPLEISRSLQTI